MDIKALIGLFDWAIGKNTDFKIKYRNFIISILVMKCRKQINPYFFVNIRLNKMLNK